jgi:tetratricopeptide (TPR) repeat protein
MALAVVAAVQVRMVPLFAVAAGPITAWNLQGYFARRGGTAKPPRPWVRIAGYALTGVAAVAFLVAAWPGWLQRPPYEPRRWEVECPPAVVQGAEFIKKTHEAKLWDEGTRTLHASPDTLAAFTLFAPADPAVQDENAVEQLLKSLNNEAAREALRKLKVTRVVVWAGDPRQVNLLDRLLAEPAEWRLLSLSGGLVVFGWNDPKHPTAERFAGWEVDFDRLAFRPNASEVAPAPRAANSRQWWEVFWTPADPPRPPARDEATVLMRKALADRDAAPVRHLTEWENGQLAGLVGAAAGWTGPGAGLDAAVRLTLFRPPVPQQPQGNRPPPQTEMTFALQKQFASDRGPIPVGVGYAAVRAARRAVADNPTDANAYLVLGRAYSLLLSGTAEHAWAARIPQIKRVREDQQVAAFNKAVALDPKLAAAHLELARLYRSTGCIDLAAEHYAEYQKLPPRWGGPKKGSEATEVAAELKQLTNLVEGRERTWEEETARQPVGDRALRAQQLELGGVARDLLLKSDVAAFGVSGTKLEIDLLLRTGRPRDVLDWVAPEVAGSLGERDYRWRRALAQLAVGDYDAADEELALMVSGDGKLTDPKFVVSEVAALLGKAVLDIGPGIPPLQQWTWNELNRADMELSFNKFPRTLRLQADMQVLRGVMALEGGNRERAAEVLRNALTFSPNPSGGGQLEFGGRTIARDVLGWLGEK